MKKYDVLYLSPHFDDAALSCGGSIHQQGRTGHSVLVTTLFGGPPPQDMPLSPLALKLHENTCGKESRVTEIRQQEDSKAMTALKATGHCFHFPCCTYRGRAKQEEWFYSELKAMYGEIHPEDKKILNRLCQDVEELVHKIEPRIIYAPLGIGNHIDHQLTHAVAVQLASSGKTVAYYEDYPYADKVHNFSFLEHKPYSLQDAEQRMKEQGWTAQATSLTDADLNARIESIWAYRSQLGGLSKQEITEHIHRFTYRLTPNQPIERIWFASS